MQHCYLLKPWIESETSLLTIFGHIAYDDPKAALARLIQIHNVLDYQTKLKNLLTKVVGIPWDFFISCFIAGRKLDIQREVVAHKPTTITQAFGLASLHEEKFKPPKLQLISS